MLDFAALADAKAQVKARDQDREADYRACYDEAVAELRLYATLPARERAESLELAAEALIEALEYQRQRAEPYLLLAGIFYLLAHYRSAQRYLLVARGLDPRLAGLAALQVLLTEALRQGEHSDVIRAVPYHEPPPSQWRIRQESA